MSELPATEQPVEQADAVANGPTAVLKRKPRSKKSESNTDELAEKKLSCMAAALMVLGESSEPMNAKEMVEAMEAKGYWTSPGGKTPHATLYSAILRELAKGDESRFLKTERGKFTARG
ncbi:MAG: winged helix-turn-helix domain-containing protein [Pirellulaceae bacterium]